MRWSLEHFGANLRNFKRSGGEKQFGPGTCHPKGGRLAEKWLSSDARGRAPSYRRRRSSTFDFLRVRLALRAPHRKGEKRERDEKMHFDCARVSECVVLQFTRTQRGRWCVRWSIQFHSKVLERRASTLLFWIIICWAKSVFIKGALFKLRWAARTLWIIKRVRGEIQRNW